MKSIFMSVKTYLMLFIFSKVVMVTPMPIDLASEWKDVSPRKPLEAVAATARMKLDITDEINKYHRTLENFDDIERDLYPRHLVEVRLVSNEGKSYILYNKDNAVEFNPDKVYLILSFDFYAPTGLNFPQVFIKSDRIIKKTKLEWHNS